jgi:hypothetical protein
VLINTTTTQVGKGNIYNTTPTIELLVESGRRARRAGACGCIVTNGYKQCHDVFVSGLWFRASGSQTHFRVYGFGRRVPDIIASDDGVTTELCVLSANALRFCENFQFSRNLKLSITQIIDLGSHD